MKVTAKKMKDRFLYEQITDSIRKDILDGNYRPGDRLPAIRDLMQEWSCTPGTVQRAYLELAGMGLVTSQVGKGTHVVSNLNTPAVTGNVPLRMARQVHDAEAFILASLTAGYSLEEVQNSINHAIDRWRAVKNIDKKESDPYKVRFSGSHDLVVTWLADRFNDIAPNAVLELHFTGSLGGLMAVAEGKAVLAGCHLLDPETQTYNEPYIRKLFPGKKMVMVMLAERRLGFMVLPGNPSKIFEVTDLVRPGVRLINRQDGSGTRVWLDSALSQNGITPGKIIGYGVERMTHSEVARSIAEGEADVGIGLETVAVDFQLEFLPLTREVYHFVTTFEIAGQDPVSRFIEWMCTRAKMTLPAFPGYDFSQTGTYSIVG
jgi:molybdate-binding protein/DNA-binding transcriptional regulator YhcF (GntR family)